LYLFYPFFWLPQAAHQKARKIDEMGHAELLEKGLSQLKKMIMQMRLQTFRWLRTVIPIQTQLLLPLLSLLTPIMSLVNMNPHMICLTS
jgi:hypothetical protein